jgi:hypothetical protein
VKYQSVRCTVFQNFEFPLSKHSRRQLLRKFRVQNFYSKLRGFEPKIWIFEPKLWVFKPKLRVFEQKLRVFENRSFVILNQSCSFYKDFFCPTETSSVFATKTLEYQIHTKFLTKFRLSKNRRNSRSFVRKCITVGSLVK